MPVRFDDRLMTVLAQPAASAHDRAIRWRQLVELAARAPFDGDRDLVRQALDEIRTGIASVDERVRVAAALAVANQPLGADLVALFATDKLSVAAPVLASARLTASEWKAVASAASDECRGFIATLRSEQPQLAAAAGTGSTADRRDNQTSIPSISEVVARVERLRQAREAGESPLAPSGDESSRLFRWECNEFGEIDWVDGAPRGALVGRWIAQCGIAGEIDRSVERALQSRAPFHGAVLELPEDAAAGGTWMISGIPAFEPASGRFAGYRGVAERPAADASLTGSSVDSNSLRELAHEIRTPLNAIIGFAEMISGEYLGPAESAYRERARQIVDQARLLLSAVEDLDFAAKLRSTDRRAVPRVDLGELAERLVASVRDEARSRNVELDASKSTADLTVVVDPDVAERLVVRLCSAVMAVASEGETLRLSVDSEPQHCTVSISRPAALRDIEFEPEGPGRAGDGDTLPMRLVMGLARTAGGDLQISSDWLTLRLPKA